MSGPVVLLGAPGTGKSKLAHQLALDEVNRTGYPLLIIDPARAWNFASYPHARTRGEIADRLWGEGKHVAFTPENEDDFEPIMKGIRAGERVIVLIDELKFVLPSARSMSFQFQMAVRLWRHAKIPAIFATTQCYQDAARPLKAAVRLWYIFRMTDPGDLDHLAKDFRLEKELVENLRDGEYLLVDRSGGKSVRKA